MNSGLCCYKVWPCLSWYSSLWFLRPPEALKGGGWFSLGEEPPLLPTPQGPLHLLAPRAAGGRQERVRVSRGAGNDLPLRVRGQ